ncbi:MAG: hypothetical protein PHH71_00990 [Clostridia bacterium]|jgi:hypothetical protein|nr:hypothetical protein [Clostridia bacterium]MDD3231727.1 hypothetical protein [Clostridia bacterium]
MVENFGKISDMMKENFGYKFLLLQEARSQTKKQSRADNFNGNNTEKMEGYLNNVYFILKKDLLTDSVELEFYPQNNEFENDDMNDFINIISKNVVGKNFLINYLDENYLRTVQWADEKKQATEFILRFLYKHKQQQLKEWKLNETYYSKVREIFPENIANFYARKKTGKKLVSTTEKNDLDLRKKDSPMSL